MNAAEALRAIAEYLTGAKIAADTVHEACAVLSRSDSKYVRHLRRELGLDNGDRTACLRFRARLAEFRQLDDQQARAEMPDLVAHRAACAACWHAWWSLQPMWQFTDPGSSRERLLGSPLCLRTGSRGVRGLQRGLPPTPDATVAAAADVPESPAREAIGTPLRQWQRWELSDPASAFVICVEIHHAPDNRVSVRLTLEKVAAAAPQAVSVEVWDVRHNRSFGSAPLASFSQGLALTAGSWLIRLRLGTASNRRGWSIPLEIETEESDGPG